MLRSLFWTALMAGLVAGCGGGDAEDANEATLADTPSAALFAQDPAVIAGLRNPASFASEADMATRSAAIFEEMNAVFSHPRCVNCHPRAESPTQGDTMRPHTPPVVRGEFGMGVPGMECTTCHGADNVAFAGATGGIPGHSPWMLAPPEMGWSGLGAADICEQIKDPNRNGDRSLDDLHHHLAEDGLVGWAWSPGEGREPAPGTQALFGDLARAWIDTGAHCPSSTR